MDKVFWGRRQGCMGWLFTYMKAVGKTHLDKVRKSDSVTVVIVREEEIGFGGWMGDGKVFMRKDEERESQANRFCYSKRRR